MGFDGNTKLKDYSQRHALLQPVSNVYTTEFEKNNRPMALVPTTDDNRPDLINVHLNVAFGDGSLR